MTDERPSPYLDPAKLETARYRATPAVRDAYRYAIEDIGLRGPDAISHLQLPQRATGSLRRAHILTIPQLEEVISTGQLQSIVGIGEVLSAVIVENYTQFSQYRSKSLISPFS